MDTENSAADLNAQPAEQSGAEKAAEPETPAGAEPPKKTAKPKKKRTAGSYALEFFIKLGLTGLAVFLLLYFVCGVYICHDNASYPMIKDGDLCLTYRLAEVQQGDAVAYRSADGTVRFGRVIACAGDSVELMNDYVTVNGYGVFEDTFYPTAPAGTKLTYPYTVPEGCVFILNDYRSDISDSRSAGGIAVSDLRGKVAFIMRRRGI